MAPIKPVTKAAALKKSNPAGGGGGGGPKSTIGGHRTSAPTAQVGPTRSSTSGVGVGSGAGGGGGGAGEGGSKPMIGKHRPIKAASSFVRAGPSGAGSGGSGGGSAPKLGTHRPSAATPPVGSKRVNVGGAGAAAAEGSPAFPARPSGAGGGDGGGRVVKPAMSAHRTGPQAAPKSAAQPAKAAKPMSKKEAKGVADRWIRSGGDLNNALKR